MNALNPLYPAAAIIKAVTFPFRAIFVVGLCFFINWFTSPGAWWFQWVAFGMGIALLCVWARAFSVIVTTVGIVGAGYLIHRWWTGRSASGEAAPAGRFMR